LTEVELQVEEAPKTATELDENYFASSEFVFRCCVCYHNVDVLDSWELKQMKCKLTEALLGLTDVTSGNDAADYRAFVASLRIAIKRG